MHHRSIVTAFLAIALTLFLSATLMAAGKINPVAGNPEAIAKGKAIFMNECNHCHGDDGSGGSGPPLNDKDWWYGGSDEEVFKSISGGQGFSMPAWLGNPLTEEDIWNVISFVRTLSE